MTGLTFEPIAHRYELDGVVVPSVTGILRASGLIDFSRIPPSILEAARERGTVVHQAIAYYNEQDLDVEQFRKDFPDYAGYIDGWISFCEQRRFKAHLTEHRVASRRRRVAGTADCFGELDGVGVLLDYATGRPQDVGKNLQTAAYHMLALEWASEDDALARFIATYPVIRRYAVGLRRDGTFRLEPYADPLDARKFTTLVEAQRIVAEHRGEWREVAA